YRGRGSACLPRVSVDRRGADRRTAAGHHQGSHALLRAARDAATREGAEVGCQSDPGGGSRIARLLPAVGLLCVLALPGAAEAGKRPPRWLVNGVCGISGGLAFTEIVATERCIQRGTCREINFLMPKGTDAGHSLGRAALKGVSALTVVRIAYVYREEHPWLTLASCSAYASFNAYLTRRALLAGREPRR